MTSVFILVDLVILVVLLLLLILQCKQPPADEPEPEKAEEKVEEKEEEKEEEKKEEEDVMERHVELKEIPEEELRPDATEEEKARHTWNHSVRKIATKVSELSCGNLRAINFCYIDRLIDVRGSKRPIAYFVPPKSSNLSHGGVFIYDTTRMADNRLYLFCGPESPENLRQLGENLLQLMIKETPKATIERIIGVEEGPTFEHMIHEIGGHVDMMQSTKNAGDQLFFEIQFFKTLLHIFLFRNNEMIDKVVENPTLDYLPDDGSAVIDTSDNALYLYIADVNSEDEQQQAAQYQAIQWMNKQPEFRHREILIFDKSTVPPNLAIIFGQTEQ